VKFHGPREADASSQPPQNLWTEQPRLRALLNSRATRKAPEPSVVLGEHGAKLWSRSWWRELRRRYTQHQPELTNAIALNCGNEHRIITGSFFLARGDFELVKRFRM
jgi:hypothetical protein